MTSTADMGGKKEKDVTFEDPSHALILMSYWPISVHSEKKWSQTGASEEPFWEMAPLCKEGPFFPKKKVKNGA